MAIKLQNKVGINVNTKNMMIDVKKTSLSIHHYLAIMIHHISCFYTYYEFSVL
jgi:hypothetical protein